MGSHMNFRNFDGSEGRPMGNNPPLARQSSIYALTFDELQNSMGGPLKDFGSMNMDEFLKNIWTAEETQAMQPAFGANEVGFVGGNLQRQGSLTLPRTLSTKTVDEVWRDLFRENGGRDGNINSNVGSNFPQRQPTLGEMTLEEFLVRAGVVREDAQPPVRTTNNSGFYGELSYANNHAGLALGYTPPGRTNGVIANGMIENTNNHQFPNQSPNLAMNLNVLRSSQQQQQLFPKQATVGYASSMQLGNGIIETGNPGMRNGNVGISDPLMNNGFMQGGVGMGMVGLGTGVTVATGSPANQLSSDGLGKSNGDTSSLSPVPYVFSGGLRGRKCSGGVVEKVVERRQRRMIKNRESAARSRARKQAYTMELEAEVARLKEENEELRKKQAEIMEMQKNQVLEMINQQNGPKKYVLEMINQQNGPKKQVLEMINQQQGPKKRCLRRTQSGPW
ncbi:bZIP transcription factor 46-like isoform X2 [Tasmannia lanceolata]|uniref:bZIP transcription factor 46-like isoform X2 n=1 Tax=Tasmannia lanceolata TaxID=3420 RepID=UPI004062CE8D